jgi:hypothetical protein
VLQVMACYGKGELAHGERRGSGGLPAQSSERKGARGGCQHSQDSDAEMMLGKTTKVNGSDEEYQLNLTLEIKFLLLLLF